MITVNLFGVRFRCHWLLLAAVGLAVAGGYGRDVALIALTLAAHELAHLFVAKGVGLATASVDLYPFGGVAHIAGLGEADAYSETVVALAGPLSNALLAAVAAVLLRTPLVATGAAQQLLDANVVMALFNLIPALPLDGGRVVRAYHARQVGYSAASRLMANLGRGLGALFVLAFAGLAIQGFVYPALPAVGVLVFIAAQGERAAAQYVLLRRALRKRDELKTTGLLPLEQLLAVDSTPARRVLTGFRPGRYHLITVTDSLLRSLGTVDEARFLDGLIALGADATAGDVLAWLREPPVE